MPRIAATAAPCRRTIRPWRWGVVAMLAASAWAQPQAGDATARFPLAETVNTFIGTREEGNTFPGASAPFGQIQVSPIGTHYAGWRYDDDRIFGFGHSFLSGAGCWEQGGQVAVLPVTGTIAPGGDVDTNDATSFDDTRYGARYTHAGMRQGGRPVVEQDLAGCSFLDVFDKGTGRRAAVKKDTNARLKLLKSGGLALGAAVTSESPVHCL